MFTKADFLKLAKAFSDQAFRQIEHAVQHVCWSYYFRFLKLYEKWTLLDKCNLNALHVYIPGTCHKIWTKKCFSFMIFQLILIGKVDVRTAVHVITLSLIIFFFELFLTNRNCHQALFGSLLIRMLVWLLILNLKEMKKFKQVLKMCVLILTPQLVIYYIMFS